MPSVKGVDKVRRSLQNLEKQTEGGVFRALEAVGQEMIVTADQHISFDTGKLKQGMGVRLDVKGDRVTVTLFNDVAYAPFVEFGTGPRVSVPGELRELANKFKSQQKGDGTIDKFLEAIKAWMKRKGIHPRASNGERAVEPDQYDYDHLAFLIAMSILQKGLKPRPFMYPAYLKGKKQFTEEIRKLTKSLKG